MATKTENLFYILEDRVSNTAPGTRLPSVRQLMVDHDVSQVTVVNALGKLKEKGYIETRVGDGTYTTGMRRTRTYTRQLRIGIATHDFPASIHYELIRDISEYLKLQGHQVLLHHFQWDSYDPFPNHAWKVDAVVMLSCQATFKAETLMRLGRLQVPLVILDRSSRDLDFDMVGL
ncbi:MAG: GntR family transcriptional regulator, partial [Planctomycetes bacterium]|nr:GntR family transcriptional regulator [Planctomycetota bacterium]